MKVVAARDEKSIAALLDNGGLSAEVLDQADSHGNTPLNYACAMGINEDIILKMIELGASCSIPNKNGAMPLNHAVYSRLSNQVLTAIVNAGGKVDYQNDSGGSALQVACVCKAGLNTVKCLVDELHADVDLPNNNGITPLMFAIRNHNDIDVVKYLCEKSKALDAQTFSSEPKFTGFTALHFAAQERLPAHAAILITNGAKTDIKDKDGSVAMQLADEKTTTAMMSSSFAKFQLETGGVAPKTPSPVPDHSPARRSTIQGDALSNRASTRTGPLRRTSMLAQQSTYDANAAAELIAHEPVIHEDDEL